MGFADPFAFVLVLPLALGWWLFARRQERALRWVRRNVAKRFRGRFSVHSARSLRRHLRSVLTMGLLLVATVARPFWWGEAEVNVAGSRILLILDASASMFASDVEPLIEGDEAPGSRLEQARRIALSLLAAFPDHAFGVASYSGQAVVHLPLTADHTLVREALSSLEIHGMYQNSGSSLTSALDLVLQYRDMDDPNLQVVILGDGELPFEESYDDALAAIEEAEIPVHTVGLGTLAGQGRLIFDFRDVVANKEEPTVLREYTTRRDDEHFRRISKRTGGLFGVASTEVVADLVEALASYEGRRATLEREGLGRDLSALPLLLFLVYFVFDSLVVGHHRKRPDLRFDLDRITGPGARRAAARLLALLLAGGGLLQMSACVDSARARAHRENENGIADDALARHDSARTHYERSREYRVEPEVPTHNLGRSATLQEDYSAGHELFQEALEISPELPEAYYNDGVTLFEWGEAERDPRGCELERTRDLWARAQQRLEETLEVVDFESPLGRKAAENREFLIERLAEIDALIAEPPPECEQQSEGGGGGGGAGGGEEGEDESEGGGGGGSDQDDPSGGGGGGGSQDEEDPSGSGGGGGGSEDEEDPSGGGGGGGPEDDPSGGGGGGDAPEEDPDSQGGGGGGGGPEDDPGSQGGGGGSEDEEPGQGGGGGGAPDPSPGPHGGGGLSAEELEQIGRELQRIAQQRGEEGKFHRRTGAEQFPREHWENPEEVIWW